MSDPIRETIQTNELLRCSVCKQFKPKTSFYQRANITRGYRYDCVDCVRPTARERSRKWRLAHPTYPKERKAIVLKSKEHHALKHRAFSLKKLYGISLEQYDQLVRFQNGLCAICKKAPTGKPLHVDHNHETDEVRGLLCHRCNLAIGLLDDDIEVALNVVSYLKDFSHE